MNDLQREILETLNCGSTTFTNLTLVINPRISDEEFRAELDGLMAERLVKVTQDYPEIFEYTCRLTELGKRTVRGG